MARVAVCLFFIAILHTGIIKFSQANGTTGGVLKNGEEITTKPTEVEPVKDSEVPSKVEADEKSEVSSKAGPKVEEASKVPEKKDDKPEEKDDTEKNVNSDNINILPDILKGAPVEHTKLLFEIPKNILGPVNAVGAKIGEAVSKSLDTAKDLAGGTFNFLKTSASKFI